MSNNFTQDELRDLFTLHEDTGCLTHDLLDCACQHDENSGSGIDADEDDEDDLPRKKLKTTAAKPRAKNISITELLDW